MKKLLLLLLLIPNLVMGENQLDKKGILCKGGSLTVNLWCEKNTCFEYKIYGYEVIKGDAWKVRYSGSKKIIFFRQYKDSLTLNRESLKMSDKYFNYTCEIALKKSDVTKYLYEQIAKSKKENKI